jgi:N utilization substance protein B
MATTSRHADRRRALALLYEADLRGDDPRTVLVRSAEDEPVGPFTITLVEGVTQRRAELDALIGRYARGWSIDRMPIIDRNLLRLGLWELIASEVPVAVAIDEAVELANELSTPDSGRFVNGVLAQVSRSEPGIVSARSNGGGHRTSGQ